MERAVAPSSQIYIVTEHRRDSATEHVVLHEDDEDDEDDDKSFRIS